MASRFASFFYWMKDRRFIKSAMAALGYSTDEVELEIIDEIVNVEPPTNKRANHRHSGSMSREYPYRSFQSDKKDNFITLKNGKRLSKDQKTNGFDSGPPKCRNPFSGHRSYPMSSLSTTKSTQFTRDGNSKFPHKSLNCDYKSDRFNPKVNSMRSRYLAMEHVNETELKPLSGRHKFGGNLSQNFSNMELGSIKRSSRHSSMVSQKELKDSDVEKKGYSLRSNFADVQVLGEFSFPRSQIFSPKTTSSKAVTQTPLTSTPGFISPKTTLNGCIPKRDFKYSSKSSRFSNEDRICSSRSGATPKSTSFTANEVVQIMERDQYQQLLRHFTVEPVYEPLIKSPVRKDAGTQVNMKTNQTQSAAFSKETLKQPVQSFVARYCKPMQLINIKSLAEYNALKSQSGQEDKINEVVTITDDIMIPEIKLPPPRTLPEKILSSPYYSIEWIETLRREINESVKEHTKQVKEQRQQAKEYEEKRLARYEEERKREQLKLKGAVFPETVTIDEDGLSAESPEITPEMDDVIDNALICTPANEVLSNVGQCQVLRKDMDTLSGLSWLNDEIINFYMALIVERGKLDNYPSVYAFSSFFYPKLRNQGHSAVRRWTRKVDIFSYDLNLVPLHLEVHWCLAVIDHRHKKIQYYDSMGGEKGNSLEVLKDYLLEESLDKRKTEFDLTGWSLDLMKGIPPQLNGSDCGMFTLKYAEYITRNAEITFTQQNMQYFRRRMVYEIMTKKLL